MKEKLPMIASGLLGFVFVFFGLNFFGGWVKMPPPPEGSPAAMFFAGIYPGFLGFVKVLEIAGGILVAIPKTRNYGLLILTPIVVNIIAFHAFITKTGFFDPPVVVVTVLTGYLIVAAKDKLAALAN